MNAVCRAAGQSPLLITLAMKQRQIGVKDLAQLS